MNTVQENVSNILNQIKSAKYKGKNSIKVKVYQLDFTGGKPHGLYLLTGMSKGCEGEKALKDLGYNITYEKQLKQVSTGYNLKGELSKVKQRDLHTTTMIIKW